MISRNHLYVEKRQVVFWVNKQYITVDNSYILLYTVYTGGSIICI